MQIWTWTLMTGDNRMYGDRNYFCSASLRGNEQPRVFATREEAEAHVRRWLSDLIGQYDLDGEPMSALTALAMVDAIISGDEVEYGYGESVWDVKIYALEV